MNKPNIKNFSKEVILKDMQGKEISKIQDIDYEAYSLALEKYITILDKALDKASGMLCVTTIIIIVILLTSIAIIV
ncbi:hypothetical protein [Coprobacillus sp. AF33-1AC]|uniref:hypothetical protein n=1 Tax=Coprobacillus sp. AF33-1AC TaxID=2292032 RepID=UPI000E4C1BC1|nr:hypothetical protein [Coprobacillus sp. AF33-1AC]RHM59669.1 hypothetical protein DWZ53_08985 [Coprobacillus sp. AF33-1AC]